MGFLSYNLNFYGNELQKLEHAPATQDRLYRARQLLRMLDDLADEGYTELNEQLEKTLFGVSRLREYLKRNDTAPFSCPKKSADTGALSYSEQDMELHCAMVQVIQAASATPDVPPLPFTDRLHRFCRWIGCDDRTAYIFLLRDTLLPFVYFLGQGREHIYPWLLSRKSFAFLTGEQNADDEIRASIYRALETDSRNFQSFLRVVLPDIRKTMTRFPQAKEVLCSTLAKIDAEKILVIESGCAGTFPLLLMSLDPRVDMRMYTTYPYLAGIFGTRIFTFRYEENRSFETLMSQERYFRYSRFLGGKFYVQKCTDAEIERQSLREIKIMLK